MGRLARRTPKGRGEAGASPLCPRELLLPAGDAVGDFPVLNIAVILKREPVGADRVEDAVQLSERMPEHVFYQAACVKRGASREVRHVAKSILSGREPVALSNKYKLPANGLRVYFCGLFLCIISFFICEQNLTAY